MILHLFKKDQARSHGPAKGYMEGKTAHAPIPEKVVQMDSVAVDQLLAVLAESHLRTYEQRMVRLLGPVIPLHVQ